jgi:hypothetical protein
MLKWLAPKLTGGGKDTFRNTYFELKDMVIWHHQHWYLSSYVGDVYCEYFIRWSTDSLRIL